MRERTEATGISAMRTPGMAIAGLPRKSSCDTRRSPYEAHDDRPDPDSPVSIICRRRSGDDCRPDHLRGLGSPDSLGVSRDAWFASHRTAGPAAVGTGTRHV